MTLIFTEQFDGGPAGGPLRGVAAFTAYSTVDATYVASPKVTGGFAGRFAVGATSANCFVQVGSTALGVRSLLFVRIYVWLDALPAAPVYILSTNLGGVARANVRINTDGTVSIRNGNTAVWSSPAGQPLAVGAWNRIGWRLDATNQQQQLRLSLGPNEHAVTPDVDSGNQLFNTGTFDTLMVGITTAATNTALVVDSMKLDDAAFIGPEVAVTAPPNSAFTAAPVSGPAPLAVQFTDTSTGSPTAWAWDFGTGTAGGGGPASQVALIGDSLTFQGGSTAPKDALVAAGYAAADVRVNGVTGRGMAFDGAVKPAVNDDINTFRAEGFDPIKWIVGLGANNMGSSAAAWLGWIKQTIDLIAAGPRAHYDLYWIGLALRRNPVPTDPNRTEAIVDAFQAAIEDPSLRTYNAKVSFIPLNWNAFIHNGRAETGLWTTGTTANPDTDGRHMTAAGYKIRNDWVAAQVPPAATAATPSATSSARNPSYTYAKPGTYTAKLTASNAGGADATPATRLITVSAAAPAAGERVDGYMPLAGGQVVPFRFVYP